MSNETERSELVGTKDDCCFLQDSGLTPVSGKESLTFDQTNVAVARLVFLKPTKMLDGSSISRLHVARWGIDLNQYLVPNKY